MNDLVSIIMPSYNTSEYIEDSIKSVINQTYDNWELIIIDDCSTDNTDNIVNKYISDKRIKYIKNKENKGAAFSRNYGLNISNGRWIAFLDSDDLWDNKKLEKQICFMEANDIYFSYTKYKEIDTYGKFNGNIITGPKRINKHKMFNFCWPGCLTVMYDSNKIGKIQITEIKKNNDYAIWLKIIKVVDLYLYDEVLASYRRGRKNSISTTNYSELIKYHYYLFRICEKQNPLLSTINTARNMLFGLIKKIIYVKHLED